MCCWASQSEAASTLPTAACKPPRDGAAFFAEKGFKGSCTLVQPGSEIVVSKAESFQFDTFARGVVCTRFIENIRCNTEYGQNPNLGAFSNGPVYVKVMGRSAGLSRCEPQSTEAVVTTDFMWDGPCLRLRVRAYDDARAIGLIDDHASNAARPPASGPAAALSGAWLKSSDNLYVKLGKDVQARLCRDEHMTGPCEDVPAGGSSNQHGLKSLTLTTDCRPDAREVALFARKNWLGTCRVLRAAVHEGKSLDFGELPFASIRVGTEAKVLLCAGTGGSGACQTLEKSERDLLPGTKSLTVGVMEPSPPASAPL
jgi:hypothetical protein